MSTLQVANLHLESTGNNRIQYSGSNTFSIIAGGTNYMTVNSINMSVNGSITSSYLKVSDKSDNYTLVSSDSGSVITVTNTAAKTITVPASLPVGFRCLVYELGTGNVVIGNAAGVSLNSRTGGYTCVTQYGSLSVFVYAANTVLVDGNLA